MGKPAEYKDISIPLFVSRYLAVMSAEKPSMHPLVADHLQNLMGDTELYSWETIRAFHAMWFQQLELGRVTWADEEVKVKIFMPWSGIEQWGPSKPTSAHVQQSQGKPAKEDKPTIFQLDPDLKCVMVSIWTPART